MRDEARAFVIPSSQDRNYDAKSSDDARTLGPACLGMQSLVLTAGSKQR